MSTLLGPGDRVVCSRLSVADNARTRMKGLLGRQSLGPGEGLLLKPAGSVHTACMRFPIDVIFLDRRMRVLRVEPSVVPWRLKGTRGARAVLEMAAGAAEQQGIAAGMTLRVADGALV
jgi:uncharacterized protein